MRNLDADRYADSWWYVGDSGGLIFIAGTQDYYLRAFDSSTGEEVWKARLPVDSQGGPISYNHRKLANNTS
ncbi:hypothetical protein [Klebsiella quasipneumoniae]|uniref:hypothetical protein n=1 Tax=Klebsiella quasipneumoniae TaxID=1463165 RepID=UPI003EB7EF4A